MTDNDQFYQKILTGLLLFVATLLFLRVFPALWGTLGVGALLITTGGLVVMAYRHFTKTNRNSLEADVFGEQISGRLAESRERADHFRTEADNILRSRAELAEQLERAPAANETAREKGIRLLTELDAEHALRLSKARFFESSADKLDRLLAEHRLHESLLQKEAELDRLRAVNHDDTAEMEKVRHQLERDQVRLETILDLTHRAAVSPDAGQTEVLRGELEGL